MATFLDKLKLHVGGDIVYAGILTVNEIMQKIAVKYIVVDGWKNRILVSKTTIPANK